ncbi:gp196 [Bacillus phage W.Ph.]|uniref:Gp196 n=1 Tax=Bacillus phage W.Ph. TaxID=764595 RepID=G9B1U7_9CAUD|nr:gp196 [Bacillus phage W.Ph.]ADH03342.1 gp196 [Bacillus phage W.Ph.]
MRQQKETSICLICEEFNQDTLTLTKSSNTSDLKLEFVFIRDVKGSRHKRIKYTLLLDKKEENILYDYIDGVNSDNSIRFDDGANDLEISLNNWNRTITLSINSNDIIASQDNKQTILDLLDWRM